VLRFASWGRMRRARTVSRIALASYPRSPRRQLGRHRGRPSLPLQRDTRPRRPVRAKQGGRPLAVQPGGRSLFWEAYWQWDRQGRRVDDQGRCIFCWETALVQIAKPATTPRVRSKLTVKVTIRSVPDDATIFSDGGFVGKAPAALTLPVGRHRFRIVLNGYMEWTGGLELITDSGLTLVAELVKAGQTNKGAVTAVPRSQT